METMRDLFTKTQYDLLPEGFPAQLIEGALVRDPSPSFGHQSLVTRLVLALAQHVDPGLLVTAPADVLIDEINVYQPDVLVLCERPPLEDHYVGTPRVAFEVLSPSTAERDRGVKARKLLEVGVEEVWLVDRHAGVIERRTPAMTEQAEADQVLRSEAVEGFGLSPAEFFGSFT